MPATKGQKYNIEPKPKLTKVLDNLAENGGIMGKAILDAGYSKTVAKSPTKLTKGKGWQKLISTQLKDTKLMTVLNEGLKAGKRIFKNNNETGEIEDLGVEPDYATRHKYLETGLKLKGYYPKEGNQTNVQINMNKFDEYK
jgi:hypothetical protein